MLGNKINLDVVSLPEGVPAYVKVIYEKLYEEIEDRQPVALHHVLGVCNVQKDSTAFGTTFNGEQVCSNVIEVRHQLDECGRVVVAHRDANQINVGAISAYPCIAPMKRDFGFDFDTIVRDAANWLTREGD